MSVPEGERMDRIDLLRPADWHLHVRQGAAMRAVVPASAAVFAQALIMPNLKPPVTTTAAALAYRADILAAARAAGGRAADFVPWMTLYLTEAMPPQEIDRAAASGVVLAAKLYPAGATTNSDAGVRCIERIYPVLERMQERGLVLCVHGEVVDPEVDIFDREAVFVERVLAPLVARFPGLKIVLEHVTTAEGVAFVREAPETVAATLTAHHLRYERNALLAGGIRPHFYCLPILKRERHRRALVEAATSGSPKFFLGTTPAWSKGIGLWLRRMLHRAARAAALRRGVRGGRRPGSTRRVRLALRRAVLRRAGAYRAHRPGAPAMGGAGSRALGRG